MHKQVQKEEQNDNQDNKQSSNENQINNPNNNKLISFQKVDLQDNNSYNPFKSDEKKQKENSIKEVVNEKVNKDYSSAIVEEQNKEIIDIDTPSKESECENEDDDWNSSKEKLKKDLLQPSDNDKIESPSSLDNKLIHSDEWGNQENSNCDNWGSNDNNNKIINNINEEKKSILGDDENKNKEINNDDNNKMEIENEENKNEEINNNDNGNNKMETEKDEIREDIGPLPLPKETENTFENYNINKNTKDSEMTWFNRDGRKEKDEYAEIKNKKILEEHEKLNKRRENKISEMESLEFTMYYVKIFSNEEPKLLTDKKRPKIRFDNLNKVPEKLKENIKKLQFDYLTPIQRAIMPYIQFGKDIVCIAETGSGKTLSYLFPIIGQMLINGVPDNPYIPKNKDKDDINKINENDIKNDKNNENENNNENDKNVEINNDNNNKNEENKDNEKTKRYSFRTNIAYPLCLIITPSRELALQISKESIKLATDTGIKTVLITGGEKRSFQNVDLSKGCDILVCTPFRLIDFLDKGVINLKMIKYLILDEADKLLKPDFYEQLKCIFDKLPKRKYRQNLLFSATFNDDVKGIAKYCLNNYYYFKPIYEIPKNIELEFYHFTTGNQKIENLLNYLKKDEIKDKSILIFVNSKSDVDSLNKILQDENIRSCSIHGGKIQNDRKKAIRDFSLGYKNVLVSTDLTSRGLDFPCVYCVINFDTPNEIDDYIHRIGRTGRLGQKGKAITYIDTINENFKEELSRILTKSEKEVPSWINDVESKKRFNNFSENKEFKGFNKDRKNNDDWGNDNGNKNRNNLNKNNNRNNKWKKNDDEGWGSNDNDNNKNNDSWGNNDNSKNNHKNDDGWGNNDNNKNKWQNNKNNHKNDDGWGKNGNDNDNDKWMNNGDKNNDSWGDNENNNNNYKNNNQTNNRYKKNEDDGWGSDQDNNRSNKNNNWGNKNNNNGRGRNSKNDNWGDNDNDWGNNVNKNYNNNKNMNNENKNRNNWKNNRNNKKKKNDDWRNNDSHRNNKDSWGDNNNNKDSWGDNNNNNKDSWGNNNNNNKDSWGDNNNNNKDSWGESNNNNKDSWGDNNNNNKDSWGDNNNNNKNKNKWNNNNSNNDNWANNTKFNRNNNNNFRDRRQDRVQENDNFNNQQNDNIEIPNDAFEELFVMGINYNSTEDDLKETFSKYGEIKFCKILKDKETQKSKGIGFVKFNDKKSAVIAMNDANDLVCQGRKLRIKYSNNKNGKKSEKRNENNNNDNEFNNMGNNNEKNDNFNNNRNNDRETGRERREKKGRGGRDNKRGRNFNNNENNDNSWNNDKNDNWNNNKNNNNKDNDDNWGSSNKQKVDDNSWGNNGKNDNGWGNTSKRERSREKENNQNDDDDW